MAGQKIGPTGGLSSCYRRAAVVALTGIVLSSCGTSGPARSAGTGLKGHRPAPTTTTTTTPPTTTTSTTDPGLLAQTDVEPSNGASLQAEMGQLWQAIVDGSFDEARPLFFPPTAYLQMKTGVISDPATDYADRLIAFYSLDLSAYRDLVAQPGSGARLVGVLVNPGDAAWIGPHTCENLIGYWHLPGLRLVYQVGSATYSFAVASLISWRGVWYVVHLGPNPRPENVGTVDQPASGPGTPGPPGGC
ncbi:MAG: hypothetical protein ACRDYB_05495 [Acidimicrobiales bacterium]